MCRVKSLHFSIGNNLIMLTVFLLVFASCVFQTVWYLICKISPKTYTVLVSNIIGGILFFPLMFFVPDGFVLLKKVWYIIILSGLANGYVFWLITRMYRIGGDVSYVTPLRQSLYIFSSVILSVIIGKTKDISTCAYVGFLLIVFGCLLLPVVNAKSIKLKNYFNAIGFLCVLTGFFAALSALFDSVTLKAMGDALSPAKKAFLFISPFRFATVIGLLPFLWYDKVRYGIDFRKEKPDYIQALEIGICVTVAYIFVCCAYPIAPDVSYVVAFRLMALPMSILGGITVFREKVYFGKIFGSILIVAGLVLSAF